MEQIDRATRRKIASGISSQRKELGGVLPEIPDWLTLSVL